MRMRGRQWDSTLSWPRSTLSHAACDEMLASRLRERLECEPEVTGRRMFGGCAFLVNGSMAVSASGQGGLMVRVDPAQTESLVRRSSTERMVMRGRAMGGWLRVDAETVKTSRALDTWVRRGLTYARSLAPK